MAAQTNPVARFELTDDDKASILERLAPDLERLECKYGIGVRRYWPSSYAPSKMDPKAP